MTDHQAKQLNLLVLSLYCEAEAVNLRKMCLNVLTVTYAALRGSRGSKAVLRELEKAMSDLDRSQTAYARLRRAMRKAMA